MTFPSQGAETKHLSGSSFTHSYQVFLPLTLAHLTPAYQRTISTVPTPNHPHSYVPHAQTTLIYLALTTSSTLCTPKRLYKTTLRFLSFSHTPHIHLTIIQSILSRLYRNRFLHRPGLSPICQCTLDTSLLYLSLYSV